MTERPTWLDPLLRVALGPEAEVVLGDLDEEWPERAADDAMGAHVWYVRSSLGTMTSWRKRGGEMGTVFRSKGLGWTDLIHHEVRGLLRAPIWTGFGVTTLAIGMTFIAGVFALSNAIRTELTPWAASEELFWITESNGRAAAVADPTLRKLEERTDVFAGVAAWSAPGEANADRVDADPTIVRMTSATPATLPTLGIEPLHGRSMRQSDTDPSGGLYAWITEGFWAREFGRSPSAIGQAISLNGRSYQIAGILPSSARLPGEASGDAADVWTPILRLDFLLTDPGLRYRVVVRAARGVGTSEVQAVGDQVLRELRAAIPNWRTDPTWHVISRPLRDELLGDQARTLASMWASAVLLLVLATANLFALSLARLQSRTREFSVLRALGAEAETLRRRLVVQNMIIAGAAAGIAVPVTGLALRALRVVSPEWLPGVAWAHLGATEMSGILIGTGLVSIAVASIVAHFGRGLVEGRSAVRNTSDAPNWKRLGRGLVLVETSVVVALAVGAGLMMRSLGHLSEVDPALSLDNRLATRVSLAGPSYADPTEVRAYTDQVLEELRASPLLEAAAATTAAPLSGTSWNFVRIQGSEDPDAELPTAELEEVTDGFFELVDLSILQGRAFERIDFSDDSERVVVVNEALAALFPSDVQPVGGLITFGDRPALRVVGIAENSPAGRLDVPPGPRAYLTDMRFAFPWTASSRWFLVQPRAGISLESTRDLVRQASLQVDAAIPAGPLIPLDQFRADLLLAARFRSTLFGWLGFVALLLGMVGIYGVISHSLSMGRRDTGVRLALGATRETVFRRIFLTEIAVVLAGATIGILLATQVGRLLGGFVFGVSTEAPWLYAGVVSGVLTISAAAIMIPALRSASADPVETLRQSP